MFVRFYAEWAGLPETTKLLVCRCGCVVRRGAEIVSCRFFNPSVLFRMLCLYTPVRWYRVIIKAYTIISTVYA